MKLKKKFSNLNVKKWSTCSYISATILKQSIEIHLTVLTDSINYKIKNSKFHDKLNRSEVIPLYKKEDLLKKQKYRPVSLLLHVLKVFEQVIWKQISSYKEDKFSKYIICFWKAHWTQKSLITKLEKWRSVLGKGGYVCWSFVEKIKSIWFLR